MKHTHIFTFALAAALTAAPSMFAQQEPDKTDNPKTHEEAKPADNKAAKPDERTKPQAPAKDDRKGDAKAAKIPQSDQEPGVKNPEAAKQQGKNEHQDAARMPQSDQEAAPQERDRDNHADANHADAKRADANKHADYHFKSDAKTKLKSRYTNISHVDRSHRVTIVREQAMPVEIRTQIEPVPMDMVSYLGPPPSGYEYGFVDGYCVVYDPTTFIVIDVIDLM